MKLMTKELEEAFAKMGSQENAKDPIVLAHFFFPAGSGDWYATEYDPEEQVFFGYANILEGEWGSFSLKELEAYRSKRFMLGIERDKHWKPIPFSQVKKL